MEPVKMLEPIIQAANAASVMEPGDYVQDGLLFCGKCHTAKQCRLIFLEEHRIVGCLCSCAQQRYQQEEAARKRQEEADRIMRLRSAGIADQTLLHATFAADDGQNPKAMDTLRRYTERWDDMQRENIGLLLYGDVGTGKSYGAACIANRLIEQSIPVCMINFSSILNSLSGFPGQEKNAYISDLMRYPLLILDDFGMERQTEYALEQIFNIIDARERSGKPLIITTNLSWSEINSPTDLRHKRIYERIAGMCVAVNFGSNGRRSIIAEEKMHAAKKLLYGD